MLKRALKWQEQERGDVRIPRMYGFAYSDCDKAESVYMPMPINLIVACVRLCHLKLAIKWPQSIDRAARIEVDRQTVGLKGSD